MSIYMLGNTLGEGLGIEQQIGSRYLDWIGLDEMR